MAAADVIGEPMVITVSWPPSYGLVCWLNALAEQNIGLLLPTSAGGAIANMAVLSLGKTIVNLNYTASTESLTKCGATNQFKADLYLEAFLAKLKERSIDIQEIYPDIPLTYLEDLKETIPKYQLLLTLVMSMLLPAWLLEWLYL